MWESSATELVSSVMTSARGETGGRPPLALPGLARAAVPGLAPIAVPGLIAVAGLAVEYFPRSPSAAASGSDRASTPDMAPAVPPPPDNPSGLRGVREDIAPSLSLAQLWLTGLSTGK